MADVHQPPNAPECGAPTPSAAIGPVRWTERHAPLVPPTRRAALTVLVAIVVGLLSGAASFLTVARAAPAGALAVVVAGGLGAALASAVTAIVAQATGRMTRPLAVYVGRDGVERVLETPSGIIRELVAFEDVAHALRERTSHRGLFGDTERIHLDLVDAKGNLLFGLSAEHRRGRPTMGAALIARVTHEYLDRRIARVAIEQRARRTADLALVGPSVAAA